MINSVPNTVGQSVSKKYSSGVDQKQIGGEHLTSHSFDYRQQSS